MLLNNFAVHAEYDHWASRVTDDAFHCPRPVGFERTAPAQDNEVTLAGKINNGRAGISLSDRKTNLEPVPCTSHCMQPVEELLRPSRPLMLRLVDIARGYQCPGFRRAFTPRC